MKSTRADPRAKVRISPETIARRDAALIELTLVRDLRLWYLAGMATNLPNASPNTTIDLAGLPEPVAHGIRQLVQALNEKRIEKEAVSPVSAQVRELVGEQPALFVSRPNPSPEELEGLLDELSAVSTGKLLPADFSRADIYDEHD